MRNPNNPRGTYKKLDPASNTATKFHLTERESMKRILTAALGAALLAGCAQVGTGYRGVVLSWEKPTGEIKTEGIYGIMPMTGYEVVPMNVQTQAMHVKASASTKDLQTVNTEATVNFHLDPAQVVKVYDNLRTDYEARIIAPTIQESVKAATAQHNAPDLLAHRAVVRDQIEHNLVTRLKPYNIIVEQVLITNFAFDDTYQKAIEQKVAAQQEAQTAQIKAQQALQVTRLESQAAIARAQGESEAQRLQRSTLTPELIRLKMVEKWDGKFPTYMMGGGAGSNPFIMLGGAHD